MVLTTLIAIELYFVGKKKGSHVQDPKVTQTVARCEEEEIRFFRNQLQLSTDVHQRFHIEIHVKDHK